MKQVLLASILAAAVSSVATFLLAEALRPPAVPPGPDPGVAALRASLEDTRRELAALKAAPPEARDGAVAAGVEPARPGTHAAAPEQGGSMGAAPADVIEFKVIPAEEVAGAAAEPARREEPSAIRRTAELVQKLRAFSDWDDSADVRSRFILMPEETFVGDFGKPDEIFLQDSGAECWVYRVSTGATDEEGNVEWKEVVVTFNRGRVIRVDV